MKKQYSLTARTQPHQKPPCEWERDVKSLRKQKNWRKKKSVHKLQWKNWKCDSE